METNVLISEVAQIYNRTARARDAGQPEEALLELRKLKDLLNEQLPGGTPAEPDSPDQAGRT